MSITLQQAKDLRRGDMLYHVTHRQGRGKEAQRWKVNGQVKTWKRSPERVQVPIKHGLYSFDYLTESDLHLVCLSQEEALA